MLALAFKFTAGRYHATAWDRHVNEGAVAWPPEPWRLLRALIATWHHKVKYSGVHQEAALKALIDALAQELPHYTLPAASHSHTRHYMPQWKAGDTSLVLDAFTAVSREEPLYVTWPALRLQEEQVALLDDLLAVMGYLGRAESWVDASRVTNPARPNCLPGDETVDASTGELLGEAVTLFAPLPAHEYGIVRDRFLAEKSAARKLTSTLPDNLLDALSVETADLRKVGWSQPPAARKVSYLRPLDALRAKRTTQIETTPAFTTVRYLLVGKSLSRAEGGVHANDRGGTRKRPYKNVLPRVEDSVRVGELLRRAIMSKAEGEGDGTIPPTFSGHGMPEGNRHQHAFYLPWDGNGDGRIDRLLVHVPAGMGDRERRIVERVQRIWDGQAGDWEVVLESIGGAAVGGPIMSRASVWESITPYLHPWHVKKGLAVPDQIRREFRERNLAEPIELERLESIAIGKGRRRCRTIHFHRFRSKSGVSQADRHGSFWRLTFSEPVSGPVAFGFGCHFGLGLFTPVSDSTTENPNGSA